MTFTSLNRAPLADEGRAQVYSRAFNSIMRSIISRNRFELDFVEFDDLSGEGITNAAISMLSIK
jgi:hypothetical protein